MALGGEESRRWPSENVSILTKAGYGKAGPVFDEYTCLLFILRIAKARMEFEFFVLPPSDIQKLPPGECRESEN